MTRITIPYKEDNDQHVAMLLLLDAVEKRFSGKMRVSNALIVETEVPEIAAFVSLLAPPEVKADPVPTSEPAKPAKAPRTPTGTCSQCNRSAVLTKTGICKPCAMRNAHKSSDQTTRAEAHELALKASAKLRGRRLG